MKKKIQDFSKVQSGFPLRNTTFEGGVYSQLVLNPPKDQSIELHNVSFIDCRIVDGTAIISEGVTLKEVQFINLHCSDALEIDTRASLENVKVVGNRKPQMIWLHSTDRTEHSWPSAGENSCYIDISEYHGEVSITGISTSSIRINPAEHFLIELPRFQQADWNEINVPPLSFWRVRAKLVAASGSKSGIFSLDFKDGPQRVEALEELEVLKSYGVMK